MNEQPQNQNNSAPQPQPSVSVTTVQETQNDPKDQKVSPFSPGYSKNIPLWRIAVGITSGAFVTFLAYFLLLSSGDLVPIQVYLLPGMLFGGLILFFVSRLSVIGSISVPLISLFSLFEFVGFGFPTADESLSPKFLGQFGILIGIFLLSGFVFLIGKRFKWYFQLIFAALTIMIINNVGGQLYVNRENSKGLDLASHLTIQLYKPSYTPTGFKLALVKAGITDSYTKPSLKIRYDGQEANFYMYQFAVREHYNPPENCGDAEPFTEKLSNHQNPCNLVGHASSGCDVYRWTPKWTNQSAAYCKLGDTLITLFSAPLTLSDEEATKLFSSLEASDYKTVWALGPH